MDNQHKKITGYRDLSQSEIDGMNSIKALEADTGKLFKQISQIEGVDPRLLALAKTNLQQGFMWFVRSIAKPRLHHALPLSPEIVKAINEMDAGLGNAIDTAKAAGLPQGLIVALLHGQACSETARMVS
ncbi:hypothetical protein FHW68_000633 [Pseudomonas sp. Tn43]|nr:hypothetical protein [Pseudomonas sp. Tn43]